MKTRVLLFSLVPVIATLSFAVSFALRDTTPPQVYVEVPDEVPAGLPFELELSADEPVTFHVSYGDTDITEVAQRYLLSLLAQAGTTPLHITAVDGAENESRYDFSIYGIPRLEPTLTTPATVLPGEPLSLSVSWSADMPPRSLELSLGDEILPTFTTEDTITALTGVSLGTPPGTLPVTFSFTDDYDRGGRVEETVTVLPSGREVEDLNLSAGILSVITPEGRALEAATVAAALARQDELPLPQWREPFLLPIQGRDTSGFGSPRRYAAGGNISYHYGSDIAAPTGTPILATNAGRVLVADFFPIKGGFTILNHGAGLYSFYLHQSELLVSEGDTVERGQPIGAVGTTGLSTGPHLHWEMRVRGVATNPMSWVDKIFP